MSESVSSRMSPRPLAARSSSSTIDTPLTYAEPYLLAERLPFTSSLATPFESGDVSPFPSDRKPQIASILGLGTHLPIFPQGLPRVGGFGVSDEFAKVIITIPTGPRLKAMLKESLCVSKWAASIAVAEAPGHTPWGDPEDTPSVTWIANGSLFSPEKFREALSEHRTCNRQARIPIRRLTTSSETRPQINSLLRRGLNRRASFHPGSMSFRKALVFEREITLDTDGERKRWSLQVPAATMNPEMVDMMIELQDLNSFFKGGLENLDRSVSVLDKEKSRLAQPTLVLSDSNFAIPISLESSPSLASEVPLAVRRGMQVPPPLTVKPDRVQDLYPGIPSAFLSPSGYSPNVDLTSTTDDLSMDLEAMVANLRSRCAPFQEFSTPVSGSFNSGLEDIPHAQYPMVPSDAGYEEDEWAFANGLTESYVKEVFLDEPTKNVNPPSALADHDVFSAVIPPAPISRLATSVETDSDISPTTPDFVRNDDAFSSAVEEPVGKSWLVGIDQQKLGNLITIRPPSTPLPPRPAIVNTSTPNRVRGILKSCKSVRFASLPSAEEVSAKVVRITPRKPNGASAASSPEATRKSTRKFLSSPPNPTPLRPHLTPAVNGATRPRTTPTSPSPPRLPKKTASHVAAKKTSATPAAIRPISVPASVKAEKRKTMMTPLPPWNSRPTVVSPKKTTHFAVPATGTPSVLKKPSQPLTPYVGRRSLGGLAMVSTGKENRPRASSSPAAPSRWSVLINENSTRRSLRDSGAQKSRMPVPLRNILTRFK